MAQNYFNNQDFPDVERPWTAEIATPHDGHKPKYNLTMGLGAEPVIPVDTFTASAKVQRSSSTKALKAQWAANAPKGVDVMREAAAAPSGGADDIRQPSLAEPMIQVRTGFGA